MTNRFEERGGPTASPTTGAATSRLVAGHPATPARLAAAAVSGLSPGNRLAQRILDVAASSAVLLVTGPLMLVIALLIKRDSPGPVLFRHERIGRDRRRSRDAAWSGTERRTRNLYGQPFVLYKFRTMYADARHRFPDLYTYQYTDEEMATLPIKVLVGVKQLPAGGNGAGGSNGRLAHDPRVTGMGRWLRRTSLDELPNFLNVLRGDMHLVGPRPDIHENIRHYPEAHRLKLQVKPGVTGLAQIRGRGRLSFYQTNEYDVDYVRRRSFRRDVAIILRTLLVTVRGDGAL